MLRNNIKNSAFFLTKLIAITGCNLKSYSCLKEPLKTKSQVSNNWPANKASAGQFAWQYAVIGEFNEESTSWVELDNYLIVQL